MSRISILSSILLLAAMVAPKESFAAIGFNGAALTPGSQLVCSGNQLSFTFTATTCTLATGPDWTATYFVDSSSDNATWFTPAGTTTGTVSNATASGTFTYTSPVLTSTTCRPVFYRVRLTGLVSQCGTPGTTFVTAAITANICPQPAPITGDTASRICIGNTIALNNVTGGGNYTSSLSSVASVTSTTGIVTGLAGGNTIISYSLPGGCASTRSVIVNPAAPAITGTNSVCRGSTANYTTAAPEPGTWSSSNTVVATIGATTGLLNALAVGTTTITFTSTATSCFSTFTVSVNPVPDAIGCNSQFCQGSTLALCETTAGGTWGGTNAGIAIVNVSTGVVIGIAGGTSPVTYFTGSGCFVTAVLSVNPLPAGITGPLSICAGGTTTLGNTTAGGAWSGDNNTVATVSTTGVVTGIAAGTVNVSYTLPTGCRTTVIVTVSALPAPIGGPSSVCLGNSITLTESTTGGVWSSINTAAGTIDPSTGVFTSLSVDTTTVIYASGAGCRATKIITVNPNPTPSAGIGTLCPGQTATITNFAFGGTWSSSNTTVATIGSTTGNLVAQSGGTTNISYILPTGCFVVGVETVNPAPASITGVPNTCIGFSTALHSSTPGGVWSSSNGAVASVSTSGVVTGLTDGTTIISYILPTGCATSVIVTVDALPAPIIGPFTVCEGPLNTITLSHPVAGGTWSSSNPANAPVSLGSGVVTGLHVGTATITYTLSSGCTVTAVVTVNPVPQNITGTLYLCQGTTTTLSDPTAGGTWSSSTPAVGTIGTNTGTVSGIAGGTTTITYTLPAGCYTTATVTVYALPVISGSALVCPNSSVTLTGSPAGGLWSSVLPVIASVGSTSGVVTGHFQGTATITYSLATSCYTTIVATVQALPSPTSGVNQICIGLTTTLSNPTAGGGTWTSRNNAVATVNATTGVVTGVSADTVSIIFTATATGCTIPYLITVNPLPANITGPTQVCVNATITLSDATPGGAWSTSGGNATVSSTGVVTGVAAGVATITYTLPTTCLRTYNVTINPLPGAISGPTAVCIGDTIVLGSATTGGTWSIAPTSIATISATGVVTPVSPGTATVSYTISPTGCAATVIITVNPLPAPITGVLNICLHDSTTLMNASTGGTWSSGNILIAVIDPNTGLLGTVTAGTATISYTLPTGCFITTVETVNPTPQPIMGTLTVCVGGTTTLTDVTTGGSWSSSDLTVALVGTDNGIVTGQAPGTAFITYTLPSSCPRVVIVTVNPNPSSILGLNHICLGSSTTLGSSSPGGTWSSSNPLVAIVIVNSGAVFSISVGSTIITYAYPTGCYTAMTFNVDPVPTANTITGDTVICVGTNTILRNPAYPTGTWTVVPAVPVVAQVISSIGGVGNIRGISPGYATIVYTLPTGCDTTITLHVLPLPTAIAGPATLCSGDSAVYTSTPAGGTWSTSTPTVAQVNPATGMVNAGVAGTATLTYTSLTGCRITTVITVNPNPAPINGRNTLCLGSTTILTSATQFGTWTSFNTTIASITAITADRDSAILNANGVGITTITYTLATGCRTIFPVTVDPLPAAITGPHVVCVNDEIQLFDVTANGKWRSSNSGIATVDTATGVVRGISPGVVTISYTTTTNVSGGCSVFYSVTVNPLPPVIYGSNNVCVGFTTTLHDTTATGTNTVGTWSSSDVTIATVGTGGVVTGIAPGVVNITFTIPTGCYRIMMFTVNPIPVVSIVSYPTIVCKYTSVNIVATGAGPGGSYSWTPATGLSCTNCPNPNASPTITTTYTVTGTSVFGCSDTAVVTVYIDSLLNDIAITGQDSICEGACTRFIATGREGTLFNWSPNVGLSCTICDTVTACPLTTTVYTVVAIDSLGCHESLTQTLTVLPLPRVVVTPNPAIICRGGTKELRAVDEQNGASTKFAWFPNVFISCDTCANPTVSDTFNIIYRVTGITPFGCADSIKVPVTVLDSSFTTINKDTTICLGASAQLYATSFSPDGARTDYFWLNDYAMTNRYIPNPVVTPTVTTTYPLFVSPNVCFPDTLYTTVKVVEGPKITITPVNPQVASGTPVTLTATIDGGLVVETYTWIDPSNTLSCRSCFTTVATPVVNTTYTFTATSVYGCSSTGQVTVRVFCESSEVFVPNTFTPNGDGVNDRFYVSGKGISAITKMQVFNRWGELVYEQHNISPNDPSAGWDGQYKGVVLEPDVFIYIIEATCNLGEHFTYKGDISIIR